MLSQNGQGSNLPIPSQGQKGQAKGHEGPGSAPSAPGRPCPAALRMMTYRHRAGLSAVRLQALSFSLKEFLQILELSGCVTKVS